MNKDEITFEGEDLHATVHVMCCDKDKFNAHVTIELTMELEKAKELLGMFPEFHTVAIKMVKTEPRYVDREMTGEEAREKIEGEGFEE